MSMPLSMSVSVSMSVSMSVSQFLSGTKDISVLPITRVLSLTRKWIKSAGNLGASLFKRHEFQSVLWIRNLKKKISDPDPALALISDPDSDPDCF
jgi:hypothetical protein